MNEDTKKKKPGIEIKGDKKGVGQEALTPKRFLNGWSKEQERLMAEWSDIATCYRWLHDQSEKIFHSKTLWINLPVIILSTVGGTANFGVQSLFESDDTKKYASFVIGSISLLAGLLTTVGNYLRYAQLEESNRVASIAWGKFQRLIAIELALHPDDRMDSMDFLKICRSDLDRLIEQSPPIPKEAIDLFEIRFGTIKELKKPDICGALEHTHIFENSEERLKKLAVDAALMLKHKKNTLNELVLPSIKENIKKEIKTELNEALERMRSPRGEIERVDDKIKNKVKFEERLQYGKYAVSSPSPLSRKDTVQSPPPLPRRDSITRILPSPRVLGVNKEDGNKNIVIIPESKEDNERNESSGDENESSGDEDDSNSLKQIVLHPNELYDPNNIQKM
jgi:hypothetical protein